MTKPLALVVYDNLLPGYQLVNRLQDLGYRVQTLVQGAGLVEQAQKEKPLVVIIDLAARETVLCSVIKELKQNLATAHIPVVAVAGDANNKLRTEASESGATLVASDKAILLHLPELLEQALRVD